MPLPASPALICRDGVVVQANAAAAALAGHAEPAAILGSSLGELLVDVGAQDALIGPNGWSAPVRVVRWPVPGTDLVAVFVTDVSDLLADAGGAGDLAVGDRGKDDRGKDRGSDIRGDVRAGGGVEPLRWRRPVRPVGTGWDVCRQVLGDDELAEERGRLLEAQRIARIGSFTWEWPTGRLHYSPAMAELFGSPCAEVTEPLQLIHPDDRPGLLQQVQEVVAHPDGGTVEVEFRGLPEDGERRFVGRIRTEHSGRGGSPRLLGTVQDVTEARALEYELREQRRRLGEAQRVARIGTWEWQPDSDRLVWSDMLLDLYGLGPERSAPESGTCTYQNYLSLVHPDDRGWVDALWRQLTVDHQPVECEHRVVRPDGKTRIFRCYGAVATDPTGPLRVVGTAQDVTEQRAAETRGERSSQRFTDLVTIVPVGIGIFDDTDQLVDANDALCGLLGYDLAALRGMSFGELTHPAERDERLRTLRTHEAAGSKSYTVPHRTLLRADGVPVYCELHVSVSVQDDGRRFLLVVFADVTERRRVAEALKHQATHDDMTGLPNRAAIKETLTELLAGPNRDIAVLFCDINNFKRVNDSLGHDAGDELLVALARRLQQGLPQHCTAARLSGDVYVVLCSDVSAHGGVHELVDNVAALLRTAIPVHDQVVRVSAAIGVAVPDSSTNAPEDLLRFADAAMFQAKRQGTGQVAIANAAMMATADRQVELEGQLRDALLHDELVLHYQPVVAADGSMITAEALIRWPHPERGLLGPEVFLPVAEQGDLLRELDRWVLRTALTEAREWDAAHGRPVAVAVNLSGLVPGDPDFVDIVTAAVAESGLPWDRLVLELVETALVGLPSQTRHAMAELVERGVRFAVDDFGTGYSSLARLKELPAQIVKVDRRFVAGVGVDPSAFAVARAVVDMARAMGRTCVAEGVETATQFQVLRGLGVDAYQGWLFSAALGGKEFRGLLRRGALHVPRVR